jgi:hypothetical protein
MAACYVTGTWPLMLSDAIIQRYVIRPNKKQINNDNKSPRDPQTPQLAFHWYRFLPNMVTAPIGMYIIEINFRIEP